MSGANTDEINIAEWSSLVARRAHNPKVVGSNPASATSGKRRTQYASEFSGALIFARVYRLFQPRALVYVHKKLRLRIVYGVRNSGRQAPTSPLRR